MGSANGGWMSMDSHRGTHTTNWLLISRAALGLANWAQKLSPIMILTIILYIFCLNSKEILKRAFLKPRCDDTWRSVNQKMYSHKHWIPVIISLTNNPADVHRLKNTNYLVSRRLVMDGEQGSDDDVARNVCYNSPFIGMGGAGSIRSHPNGQN